MGTVDAGLGTTAADRNVSLIDALHLDGSRSKPTPKRRRLRTKSPGTYGQPVENAAIQPEQDTRQSEEKAETQLEDTRRSGDAAQEDLPPQVKPRRSEMEARKYGIFPHQWRLMRWFGVPIAMFNIMCRDYR